MKFTVSASSLLKQLQAVGGVLSTNAMMPILENFLFEINSEQLTISATDLQTSMTTLLPVESSEDGKVAVPARILIDTLKTFAEQPVSLSVNPENFVVELEAGAGKYRLAGEDADDFPKIPTIDDANTVNLTAAILSEAISKTLFAVSSDDLRPAMMGVFCQLSAEGMTFVATDAHRLVRYRRTDVHSETETSFILPKKAMNLLKSSLSGEAEVQINYNKNSAFFRFNNTSLICRLIDERYPDYEAVIPKKNANKLTIDRLSFLNSLKRVVIYANKTTHQVRLKISGSELNISSEDLDFSNEAHERLACHFEGENMEIGFNAKFLIDMLSNLVSQEVVLEMSTPNRAGILLPGTSDANESVLMLVMPVMLSN